ncbi:MAG: type II toxin-antitoxin system VapC family toxin [Acidobacteria bacterium]|nr:type II toxin-antitoxin system VapC family toxin [Acidobacteriota bacterium]
MALYYFDTSALVKLYIRESGTDELLRLVKSPGHSFAVLSLTRVEFQSAIRRRHREGDLSAEALHQVVEYLQQHWASFYLVQPVTETVVVTAVQLLDRHPLRAYDAVQLAGSLVLHLMAPQNPPTFVCADADLTEAARKEGMATLLR